MTQAKKYQSHDSKAHLFLLPGLFAVGLLVTSWPAPASAETATGLVKQAEQLYRADKLEESIAAYRQALALEPDSPILQYNLGTALARKGQTNDAISVLHQSATEPVSPARPDALFNLGTTLAESVTGTAGTVAPGATGPQAASPATPTPGAPGGGGDLKGQIETLEKSLQAFREAILNDARPKTRQEAQYNYEVTQQLLQELKRQQEQQQQQQQGGEQQNQDQQQQNQNQQNQNQQNQNQQQGQQNPQNQQDQQNQQQQGQNQENQNQQQQQHNQNQPQGQDGQNQQQGQPTPTPTPAGDQQGGQQQQPGATPTPSPQGGQQGDQQNDRRQGESQDRGLEGQGTPTPTPTPDPRQQGQPREAQGQQEPKQEGGAAAGGGQGVQPRQTPTPEQLNAMRLLNMLEQDNPEQYKKLYQFRGRNEQLPEKDW